MKSRTKPDAQRVLAYLEQTGYRPQTQSELMHGMQVTAEDRPAAREAIRELLSSGRAVKLSRGRLAASTGGDRVVGRLQRHPDGFGFVVPDEGGDDVFVARRDVGPHMTGDRVAVRITRRGQGNRRQGIIVETLERRTRKALGVFVVRGDAFLVLPFDPDLGPEISIPGSFRLGAKDRDVVEVQLLRVADGRRKADGKVLHVIGRLGTRGVDIEVVIRRFDLRNTFPPPVVTGSKRLPDRIPPSVKKGRERFDDPPPITIDGETAKDFDDAIAVERLPKGGYRLFVHIADVSHFVKPGDPIDDEARLRGTSVYFPGRVVPMLPEKLSNDLCSLRPGVDRLVLSAILDLDRNGDLRRTRFADGIIRSAARLTYTNVAEFFDDPRRSRGIPARVRPMLDVAKELHETLRARRRRRGGFDIDLPEPTILLDVEGEMTGIAIEPRNRAHELIEECMILANEAVAGWLESHELPCMYRNHERPDPFKLEALAEFAESLGFPFEYDSEDVAPHAMRDLLDSADDRPERRVLSMVVLRSMQQARYSMTNIGHFGLASDAYCHFTSPIRRYPDLVVHRLLRAANGPRDKRSRQALEALSEGLEAVAETSCDRERNAEAAEREVLAWKKVAFMSGREGEVFDAVVTGVARFGVFVQFVENQVEGLLRVDRLGDERFEFDATRMRLTGDRTGKSVRLGDAIRVRIDRVDTILRRIDLSPVGNETESGSSPDKGAKGRRSDASGGTPASRRRKRGKGSKAGGRRGRTKRGR